MVNREFARNGLAQWATFLNVNFPNMPMAEMTGVKICKQGTEFFEEYFNKRTDP